MFPNDHVSLIKRLIFNVAQRCIYMCSTLFPLNYDVLKLLGRVAYSGSNFVVSRLNYKGTHLTPFSTLD